MMVPLAWMISTSLKADGEVFLIPIRWIPSKILFSNYPAAVTFVPYMQFFANSIVVAALSVGGAVFHLRDGRIRFRAAPGSRSGYPFLDPSQYDDVAGRSDASPDVPDFQGPRELLDTYWPLIVPSWLGGSAFYIFLLRQFFLTLPLEMDEAAKIDGASLLSIFWRIILPLAKPGLATVAIFAFFDRWNAFQAPLIYLNSMEKYTVPVGLRFYLSTMGNAHWNYLMAATLIAIIPPIFVFFTTQRYFVEGAALTGD